MNNYTDKKNLHLKKLTDKQGFFKIVAIDHREVYVSQMKKMGCENVDYVDVVSSKMELIKEFNKLASGFLLDPEYSLKTAIQTNALNGKGLMVGIEGNDYSDTEFKENYLTDKISVEEIAEIGGDCVKLFIYYYFDSEIKRKQIELVRKVSELCMKNDLPFLIEPILAPKYQELPILEQVELNKKMVDDLQGLGIDVFKLLFPSNVNEFSEEECVKHCKYVTSALDTPYILLTSGVDIETFFKQLKCFSMAGGSGFAVGRSLWQQCVNNNHQDITSLKAKMLEIFDKTCKIVTLYGKGINIIQ